MGLENPTEVLEKWMQQLSVEEKSAEMLCRASEGQLGRVAALLEGAGRDSLAALLRPS